MSVRLSVGSFTKYQISGEKTGYFVTTPDQNRDGRLLFCQTFLNFFKNFNQASGEHKEPIFPVLLNPKDVGAEAASCEAN